MANRKRRNGEAPPAAGGEFSLISNEKLFGLYSGLLACRAIGRQGTNGKSVSICGHDAALVGATIDLGDGDAVCSHEHGVLTGFSDGSAIRRLLLQPGNHGGGTARNGMALNQAGSNGASPVAHLAFTHAAIGTALANKTRTNRKVAVVFSSDACAETLREAVHIATVHALPMVFVHQSESDGKNAGRTRKRSKKNPSELKTPWFPSITVDCHDVVALYRVAFEAISRARLGRGPTLIECRPFRMKNGNGAHAEDPVLHMEHYLRAKGLTIPG